MSLTIKVNYPVCTHDVLLEGLRALPIEFAPIYFSTTERVQKRSNRLDNDAKFAELLSRSKRFSFTLLGEKISYHLSPTTFRDDNNIPTHGYLFVEVKKGFKYEDQIESLFKRLLEINGVDFAYMCEHDEFIHRNRLIKTWDTKQSGSSGIEFVIGVNFTRYVPGLYWKTAFSEEYLSLNKIDIELLRPASSKVDVVHRKSRSDIYIFTFFGNSEEWRRHKDRLDRFIADKDVFFSLNRLQSKIDGASSEKELRQVVSRFI